MSASRVSREHGNAKLWLNQRFNIIPRVAIVDYSKKQTFKRCSAKILSLSHYRNSDFAL